MTTQKVSQDAASAGRDVVSTILLAISAVATVVTYFAMSSATTNPRLAYPLVVIPVVVTWCGILFFRKQIKPVRVELWQLLSLVVCLVALGLGFVFKSLLPISVAVVCSMVALFGSFKNTKHRSPVSGFAAFATIALIPLTTTIWFQEWVMRFMKNVIHFGLRAIQVPNVAFPHVIAVEEKQIVLSDLANSDSLIWAVLLAGVFTLLAMRGVTQAICNLMVAYVCGVLAECARVILYEYLSLQSAEPVSETLVAVMAYGGAVLVFLSLEQMLRVAFHPIGVGFISNRANPFAAAWNKLVRGMRDSREQYDWWRSEGHGHSTKGGLLFRVLAGILCVLVTITAPALAFSELKRPSSDSFELSKEIQSELSEGAVLAGSASTERSMSQAVPFDLMLGERNVTGVAISHLEAIESGELSVVAGGLSKSQLIAFSRLRGWDEPAIFANAESGFEVADASEKTMSIFGYVGSEDGSFLPEPSSGCVSLVWNREWLQEPSNEELQACYEEFSAFARHVGKTMFER